MSQQATLSGEMTGKAALQSPCLEKCLFDRFGSILLCLSKTISNA